jgi:predicted RNase H-like HicB family nuclease
MRKILVNAIWDKEASVWVATSEQVPGLVTEAATAEELEKKLMVMIPELLVENGLVDSENCHQGIPFDLHQERELLAQGC